MSDRDTPEYAEFMMDRRGCIHCSSEDSHEPWCVHYEDALAVDPDDEEGDGEDDELFTC